jgi:hypothetical protein
VTRWHKLDLTGRLIKASIEREGSNEWEVIELLAIMPATDAKPERQLWPQYWPLKELLALRAEPPASKWSALYQQTPTAEEGLPRKEGMVEALRGQNT